MIRALTKLCAVSGVVALAATASLPAPAHALMVSAESALVCPQLEDFQVLASGRADQTGAGVPRCRRVERYVDLYGPVGRASNVPGGPYVRVRLDDRLFWAEENAFYLPASSSKDDAGLTGAAVPLPPIE